MATVLELLEQRRLVIAQELAAMNNAAPGGKPNVTSGDGVNVDHVGYRLSLYKELEQIEQMIRDYRASTAADGIVAVESQGYV